MLKKVSMGHQNILTLVDYFETMNNRTSTRPHYLAFHTDMRPYSIPSNRPRPRGRALRPNMPERKLLRVRRRGSHSRNPLCSRIPTRPRDSAPRPETGEPTIPHPRRQCGFTDRRLWSLEDNGRGSVSRSYHNMRNPRLHGA